MISAFLALCEEDEKLNAEKAREIWPGLESVLWAALSETKSMSGAAILPASVGLQQQNGSPRKPELSSAKLQAIHRPGNGIVISGTPGFSRGDMFCQYLKRNK